LGPQRLTQTKTQKLHEKEEQGILPAVLISEKVEKCLLPKLRRVERELAPNGPHHTLELLKFVCDMYSNEEASP